MSLPQTRDRPPSLLACNACRRKHLKCDARMPVCARCELRGLDCMYIESRRGYKGPRKSQPAKIDFPHREGSARPVICNDGADLVAESGFSWHSRDQRASTSIALGIPPGLFAILDVGTKSPGESPTHDRELLVNSNRGPMSNYSGSGSTQSVSRDTDPPRTGSAITPSSDRLLDSFYKNFFPAHPFVIPRRHFKNVPAIVPVHLKRAMRFVASHYLPDATQDALQQSANMVFTDDVVDDGFKVQSMLLLAMSFYARFEQVRGAAVLECAIDLALRIGMNHAGFSSSENTSDPILQESWRRTWWDLYIVDGLISALSGSTHVSRLQAVECDVPLPGSCDDYVECRPQGSLRTLQNMQDRAFSDDGHLWSSFAYKIEAMRIMYTVLQLGADTFATKDAEVEVVDASLSNFMLSLPRTKREIVERDGRVDEVLFGAHIIIHWAAINLHRPRSSLTFVRNHYSTACTKEEAVGMPALAYASHNSKVLRAANEISNLAAIQSPAAIHTPCYACAIALAATVQLPSCVLAETIQDQTRLKERLRLSISALGVIGEVWALAGVVKEQVAQFARETLVTPANTQPSTDQFTRTNETAPVAFPQIDMDSMLRNENWLDELLQSGDALVDTNTFLRE